MYPSIYVSSPAPPAGWREAAPPSSDDPPRRPLAAPRRAPKLGYTEGTNAPESPSLESGCVVPVRGVPLQLDTEATVATSREVAPLASPRPPHTLRWEVALMPAALGT
eukprot:scaffold8229_cov57-Phaeocystis_antarctica.AAC.2